MGKYLRDYFTGESAKFHLLIGLLFIVGIVFIAGAEQLSQRISTYVFYFPKEIIEELVKHFL